MTKEEAIKIARNELGRSRIVGEISAKKSKQYIFWGKEFWTVETNIDGKGMNGRVVIEDETAKVICSTFLSR